LGPKSIVSTYLAFSWKWWNYFNSWYCESHSSFSLEICFC